MTEGLLSAWKTGRNLPSEANQDGFFRVVRLLTEHARGRALRGHTVGQLLDEVAWTRILKEARAVPLAGAAAQDGEIPERNQGSRPPKLATHIMITGPVTGPVVQAGTVTGGVHLHSLPRSTPVPRQLPPAPEPFVGRREELARLDSVLDSAGTTIVVTAVTGTGGIGKTWLALQWAHKHSGRFIDGQLFADLRGFSPAGQPTPPGTAVRGFLDALGVEPGQIPVDLDAQVGLYRSLVANKRILIVLDNAHDTTQVAQLLPDSSTCTVLVTSRDQLPGLVVAHGGHRLVLDVLDDAQARELLARRLGQERMDAEPNAVNELLTYCAGLPLVLGVVGGRADAHPDFPLTVLATELRDTRARLDALDEGDITTAIKSVLSWSYAALSTEHANAFGLLGLAPGPEISPLAAAELFGLTAARTGMVLRALERVSLLRQPVPGRWQMHELVRLYAVEQAHRDQPEEKRDAALRRLANFYLYTAHDADRLLYPHRDLIALGPHIPNWHAYSIKDDTAALQWFDAEHACLLATQRLAAEWGWHDIVWQLAWSLDTFQRLRSRIDDQLSVWQLGLGAAEYLDDKPIEALAHRRLGRAYTRVGNYTKALYHLGQALDIDESAKDLANQGHSHQALAWACGQAGDNQQALKHALRSLSLYQTLDNPVWIADALNQVGWYAAQLGEYEYARMQCEAALTMFRCHEYQDGEADTLDSLGYIAHRTGHQDQALDYYQQALALFKALGNTYNEANVLERLGNAEVALGHHDQAHDSWQKVMWLYQNQHRTEDAERIQRQLDDLTGRGKLGMPD